MRHRKINTETGTENFSAEKCIILTEEKKDTGGQKLGTYDKNIFGKNYIRIKTRLFRKQMYAYIDTSEYLADRLFAEQKLAVRYKAEFEKEGTEYMVICCIVRKKDEEKFLRALEKMEDKNSRKKDLF